MDSGTAAYLASLAKQGRANDEATDERRKKMLNLDPDTARLVAFLVQMSGRKNLLEIGTSNGYSTIWLASALRETGGRITTIDREQDKCRSARDNLKQAGLEDIVDVRCGDASQIVSTLSGPFDCVFFDADRVSAPDQLSILLPKLEADVILLADNALSHPEEIAGYLSLVKSLVDFESFVVPVGKGLSIAYRTKRG